MNIKPIKLIFAMSLYEINGACAVAKNLIDNLDRRNFEIVLIAERIAEQHFELVPDVKIIDLGLKPEKTIIKKIFNIINHIKKLKQVIITEHPDIILSFGTILNCYILFALNKTERKDIKIIISEHSEGFFIDYNQPLFKDFFLRKIYKVMIFLFYKKADCIIAVSKNIAGKVEELLGSKERVKVIYNPVNIYKIKRLCTEEVKDFNFEEGIPYIVIVSRLSPEKGIDHFIEAFANLIHKIDSRLMIIGDGVERNNLENLTEKYSLRGKIKFIGWQDNPFKFLKKAEVLVLSSIYEGFPNVILEAMACGVPVVTSRSAMGIEEIIEDGVDGILANSRDPLVLSDTIYNLLLNKALRERIINGAYKKVERFDVSKIIKEYESTLAELINNN